MKEKLLPFCINSRFIYLFFGLLFFSLPGKAQLTYLTTAPPLVDNNGSSAVAFNVKAYKKIRIKELSCAFSAGASQTTTVWYKVDSINGAPNISTTNGWIIAGTATWSPAPFGTGTIAQIPVTNLSIEIPAGATYAIAISGASVRYAGTGTTVTNPALIADQNIHVNMGASVGYGGTLTGVIAFRQYCGKVGYQVVNEGPNNASISALVAPRNFCGGPQDIKVRLKNNGTNVLSNATIAWTLDGVLQTPITWISPLDTFGGTLYPNDTVVTLGNTTFTTASKVLKAWSEFPNAVNDTVNYDDTITVTLTPALSGTYTIGGVSANYPDMSAAITALSAAGVCGPVVFNVTPGSGPFNTSLSFSNISGTNSTNTITFNGNGNTITSTVSPLVSFNNVNYITLDSFNIIGGTGFAGTGVYVTGASHHLTFNKNVINVGTTSTATANIGFAASGSATAATTVGNNAQYITFTNNQVIGGYYCFTLIGSASYLNNYGHYIANNTFKDFYLYGVYLSNADTVTFINNDINRATRGTVTTLYGIYLATSRNLKIQKNRLHDFGVASYSAYPMYITNCVNSVGYETEVSNNMIYNVGTTAIMYGIYSLTTAITGFNFYHNTIQHDVPPTSASAIRGAFFSVAITNVNFKNNIINITGGGTVAKYGIYVTTASTSFISNNNTIRVATSSLNNIGYWTADRVTLAAWQTASGQDVNSTTTDPSFTNLAGGNLKPLSVILDNQGSPVGITTDIVNVTRSTTTPDIGAYEFSTAFSCTGTPGAGQAVTNKTYVCSTDSVLLSLVNDTVGLGLTYQWLASTTGINGTYNVLVNDTVKNKYKSQTTTTWYKCIVACSGNADTSDAVMVRTTTTPFSGNYTINKNLPQTASNFTDFNDLAIELSCVGVSGPVIFNVDTNSGPYAGYFTFTNIPGASDTNTITFNGNGNTITSNLSPIVSFNNASYITLDSFNITGGIGFAGTGVYVTGASHHLTFNRNVINVGTTSTVTTNIGFAASGSATGATTVGNNAQYITFTNNQVIGGYYSFTLIGNASYLNNYGHYIANNTFKDFYVYGVYLSNADTVTFINNDINRATRGTVSTLYGIYLNVSRNLKIQKNRLHDFGVASYTAYPMYIANCVNGVGYETEVSNNMIYNVGTTAVMYGIYSLTTAITGFNFYHNTIQHDVPVSSTSAIRGAFFSVAITNVNFKNNIINITGGGTVAKYGIYVTTASTSFISNNNTIRVATSSLNNIGYWTADRATMAAWQTASGQDANSVTFDPVFSNAAVGNLTPLSSNIDNIGTPVGIGTDITGAARSITTPDMGAFEFTGIAGDIAITSGVIKRSNVCYSTTDTVQIGFSNLIGQTVDFTVNPLTISWNITGPVNSSGNIVVNTDTLAVTGLRSVFVNTADLSQPGTYTLRAYLQPNAINTSATNDTLGTAFSLTVQPILSVVQRNFTVNATTDSVTLQARSPLFPGGEFMITEICHNKNTVGPPVGGWPAWHTVDDYIEITGVPNSDLGGYALEQWSATALLSTHTFPTGTILSPAGTAIIAVGTVGTTTNNPANFFYLGNGGYTGTFDSGLNPTGRILKNSSGSIVDAVGYSGSTTYAFPTAANVPSTDWSGAHPASNGTCGLRLTGADVNSPTNWVVVSNAQPQDPNVYNVGVPTPSPSSLTGFTWTLNSVIIDTVARKKVGGYTTPGVYQYVAQYITACGTFYDTVFVTATSTVPVKLLSFTANKTNADVLLTWSTASEKNVDYFEVFASTDGKNFNRLEQVKATGNSEIKQTYAYLDAQALNTSAKQLYYKLNMVDMDGSSAWSNTAIVDVDGIGAENVVVYPNPFDHNLSLKVTEPADVMVEITTLAGVRVFNQTYGNHQGNIEINNLNINAGMYIISTTQNGVRTTQKLVKQ